jgi:hypothetical protein
MRHRLVGTSARGLLAVLFSISTAWAQSVSTAQINGAIRVAPRATRRINRS